MQIETDHFVRGVLVKHGDWTALIDRLGVWLVRDGRVVTGIRWWR